MSLASGLYAGDVMHERRRPKRYRLDHRVFSLLLDLDELPELDKTLRLFGYNGWAPLSFRDADHGDGGTTPLRQWVDRQLMTAGVEPGGRVRVLCYPRMFGYVFNPLTVYFCHAKCGKLATILYEVSNTHHERHTYVLPVTDPDANAVRHSCRKAFFVSPFVPMGCRYDFRVAPPGERVVVSILEHDDDGPLLTAKFSGRRKALSDAAIAWAILTHPLMTIKVIAAIHWHALRLWLKGVPVQPYRRAKQAIDVSFEKPVAQGARAQKI